MYIQDLFIRYYDIRPFGNTIINKFIGNSSKILGLLANILLPIYFKFFPGKRNIEKTIPLIISFTTFPNRINNIWLVIECMLRQRKQPQLLILFLSKEQFSSAESLPQNLKKYIKSSFLKIELVGNDFRSHKKYWYIVQQNDTHPIVTIDDDIIYSSHTIETLWENYKRNEKSVIACYCKRISWDTNYEVLPYSQWKGKVEIGEKGMDIFFGSGGGTLFPEKSLFGANEPYEIISKVCPSADDIWLNAIIRKNGYTVMKANARNAFAEWFCWNNIKLSTINNDEFHNDRQLKSVMAFFKEKYGINPFKI